MIKALSILAVLEGISYLLLLGICMPLKYIFNIPEPTYPVGLAHGVLFVAYCGMVVIVSIQDNWRIKTTFFALAASLLPFAPFYVDRKILKQKYASK